MQKEIYQHACYFFTPLLCFPPKARPGFIAERLNLYEELKRESDALLGEKAAGSKPITVELPDGRKVMGKSWITTPYQLACDIRLVTCTEY